MTKVCFAALVQEVSYYDFAGIVDAVVVFNSFIQNLVVAKNTQRLLLVSLADQKMPT